MQQTDPLKSTGYSEDKVHKLIKTHIPSKFNKPDKDLL